MPFSESQAQPATNARGLSEPAFLKTPTATHQHATVVTPPWLSAVAARGKRRSRCAGHDDHCDAATASAARKAAIECAIPRFPPPHRTSAKQRDARGPEQSTAKPRAPAGRIVFSRSGSGGRPRSRTTPARADNGRRGRATPSAHAAVQTRPRLRPLRRAKTEDLARNSPVAADGAAQPDQDRSIRPRFESAARLRHPRQFESPRPIAAPARCSRSPKRGEPFSIGTR